MTSARFVPIL